MNFVWFWIALVKSINLELWMAASSVKSNWKSDLEGVGVGVWARASTVLMNCL